MIEWKQQGQVGLLEGSGKKLKLEQRWFDPSSCSGLESALARQLVG